MQLFQPRSFRLLCLQLPLCALLLLQHLLLVGSVGRKLVGEWEGGIPPWEKMPPEPHVDPIKPPPWMVSLRRPDVVGLHNDLPALLKASGTLGVPWA